MEESHFCIPYFILFLPFQAYSLNTLELFSLYYNIECEKVKFKLKK
jgi:hypothetical protein